MRIQRAITVRPPSKWSSFRAMRAHEQRHSEKKTFLGLSESQLLLARGKLRRERQLILLHKSFMQNKPTAPCLWIRQGTHHPFEDETGGEEPSAR